MVSFQRELGELVIFQDDWFHIAKPFPYVGHVGKV
jgi:hypothetical protein